MKKDVIVMIVAGTLIVLATIWVVKKLTEINKTIKATKSATTT